MSNPLNSKQYKKYLNRTKTHKPTTTSTRSLQILILPGFKLNFQGCCSILLSPRQPCWLKKPLLPSPRVLFLTWIISVIPFTAQPHSCNRTEEQQLGCEDRNRWLGLRRKTSGISQAGIFTQADAPPNPDPEGSRGLRTRARTKSARRFTFSVCLPHDTNLLISSRLPPGPKSHKIHYHPRPCALPSFHRHQTLA